MIFQVPSDILPLIVILLGVYVFLCNGRYRRNGIPLHFCDEAHLYVPERAEGDAANEVSIRILRKSRGGTGTVSGWCYGQRPSEVNHMFKPVATS